VVHLLDEAPARAQHARDLAQHLRVVVLVGEVAERVEQVDHGVQAAVSQRQGAHVGAQQREPVVAPARRCQEGR